MHSASDGGHSVRTVLASVHVIGVGSRFPFRLTLVLEPDSNRFYFPVIPDNGEPVVSELQQDDVKWKKRTCRLPLRLLRVRPVTDVNFGERGFPT